MRSQEFFHVQGYNLFLLSVVISPLATTTENKSNSSVIHWTLEADVTGGESAIRSCSWWWTMTLVGAESILSKTEQFYVCVNLWIYYKPWNNCIYYKLQIITCTKRCTYHNPTPPKNRLSYSIKVYYLVKIQIRQFNIFVDKSLTKGKQKKTNVPRWQPMVGAARVQFFYKLLTEPSHNYKLLGLVS